MRVVTGPSHGTATTNPSTGHVNYVPDPDYNGAEELTYEVCEGDGFGGSVPDGKCDRAKVSLEVGAVNDAPVAYDDTATTEQDSEGDRRQGRRHRRPGGRGRPGADRRRDHRATRPGQRRDRRQRRRRGQDPYTPDADYTGSDSFEYRVCDDGEPAECATATVEVTVTPAGSGNDAPAAQPDSYDTDEDDALEVDAPGVLDNDSDPDDDPMRASRVDGPAHGMLSLDPTARSPTPQTRTTTAPTPSPTASRWKRWL